MHPLPAPLVSRFIHLKIRVDAEDWCAWGVVGGIAPEVLLFVLWDASHNRDNGRAPSPACLRP